MIALDSLTVVLAAELIAVLILALVLLAIISTRRRRRERDQVGSLVEHLRDNEHRHREELTVELEQSASLDPTQRAHAAETVREREHALYKLVVEAFLTRDPGKLEELGPHVRAVAEPYRALLKELASREPAVPAADPSLLAELDDLRTRLHASEAASAEVNASATELQSRLEVSERTVTALQTKLSEASEALDSVAREYTKMFGEPKTEQSLEQSRQRFLSALAIRNDEPEADGVDEPEAEDPPR